MLGEKHLMIEMAISKLIYNSLNNLMIMSCKTTKEEEINQNSTFSITSSNCLLINVLRRSYNVVLISIELT